jgi:hypothetical protein
MPEAANGPSDDFAQHARLSRPSDAKPDMQTSRAPWIHKSFTYRAQI